MREQENPDGLGCSIRRWEGSLIHDHPDINPCPKCGAGRKPDQALPENTATLEGDK